MADSRTRPILPLRHRAEQSFLKFVDFAQKHPANNWVFRGHADRSWTLKPTVSRAGTDYSIIAELKLLDEFKRSALSYLSGTRLENDWEWLALAQHHGLPTRLLDWTMNPLVAAYFASQPLAGGEAEGEVIAVKTADVGFLDLNEIQAQSPFDVPENKFVLPSEIAPRINSQSGLFSIQTEPDKDWLLPRRTRRFRIDAEFKPYFLTDLWNLGIDAARLMADLDGLCAQLKWRMSNGLVLK